MGYDLHITRRSNWSDSGGPAISESEWLRVVNQAPDAEVFYWHNGEVSVKNPEPALIATMVRFATLLSSRVQGDDGEIYREDGSSFQPSVTVERPGILRRMLAAWARRKRRSTPPFTVGQRVKDILGGSGTVVHIDPNSRGGMGTIRVRMDDGREQNRTCLSSGFEIVDED